MIPAHDTLRELPPAYRELRDNVGEVLRARRKELKIKQAVVASDARIQPESLSRIENKTGGRVPKLEVVEALILVLDLGWEHVALPVEKGDPCAARAARLSTNRADKIFDFGQTIREARRTAKMSLDRLSEECGLSKAHLSRVERGLSGGPKVFKDVEGWLCEPREEREVEIANQKLADLVSGAPTAD